MGGLEEKGFGFEREAVCSTGKRRKKEQTKKKKKVLMSFAWDIKLDRYQNFK